MQSPSQLKAKSEKRLNNTNAILRSELCGLALLQMIACYNEAKLEFGRTGPRNEPGMNPLVEESLVLRRAIVLLSGGGKATAPTDGERKEFHAAAVPENVTLEEASAKVNRAQDAKATAQKLVDKWGTVVASPDTVAATLQCRADVIEAFKLK